MESIKMRVVLLIVTMALCTAARAGYSQDSGRITQLFMSTEGAVAVTLDVGFANAIATRQCPVNDGYWAGIIAADPLFKAVLLSAKSKGSTVVITTEGCEGNWFKIIDIYVK